MKLSKICLKGNCAGRLALYLAGASALFFMEPADVVADTNEVVISSFSSNGKLTFIKQANAAGYRVEWASESAGSWTGFTGSAGHALDNIPADGGDPTGTTVNIQVPMLYRVVALVTNAATSADMVLVPAGSFVMGNSTNTLGSADGPSYELPQHDVYVSGFYIDRFEVTRDLWDDVTAYNAGNGYSYSNAGAGKETNHPVHSINWFDAVKWCNARSEMDGYLPVYYQDAGYSNIYKIGELAPYVNWDADGFRLPTEAEWEKAARGGVAGHRFPWSDTDTVQHVRANYNSIGTFGYDTSATASYHPAFTNPPVPYTSPVGSFTTNGLGLYDMAGNVWEFCWDWYDENYYTNSPSSDPAGPASSPYGTRVHRGGSWASSAYYLRVGHRYNNNPESAASSVGFRCVRVP